MNPLAEIAGAFVTYQKEITLILVTSITTFIFMKAVPTILDGLKHAILYFLALCTGRGKQYSFVRQYLKWMMNEHRYSTVIPSQVLDPEKLPKQPRLEDIYIRLQLRDSTARASELPVQEVLAPGARTVILGDPGAGKTTYLRYVALVHAKAGLASLIDVWTRRDVKQRLGVKPYKIPVFLHLNRLYRDDRSSSVLQTIHSSLPEVLRRKCPREFFEKLLERGDVLMLLDGLDEIASPDQRLRAAREIGEIANSAHQTSVWIVTSRAVGYVPRLQQHNFSLAMVQHLTRDQVRKFITRWYQTKCETADYKPDEIEYQRMKHKERTDHLIDALESNAGLSGLATSPMMVSLIAMLHSVRPELPENRAILYRDCVELFAGRWDVHRGVSTERSGPSVNAAQKLAVLVSLAWKMHTEKRREIHEREVVEVLDEQLGEGRGLDRQDASKRLIESLLERSGLIISRGTGPSGDRLLAFSHLSFQEYLVSCHLRAKQATALVLHKYTDSWWKEAILLYVAQLESPLDITRQIYERAKKEWLADGLAFAGRCLAEVQADKREPIYSDILCSLVTIASGSQISRIHVESLSDDRNNLFLRYLLDAVEHISRLRPAAVELILRHAQRSASTPELRTAALEQLTGSDDVICFDRQFAVSALCFEIAGARALVTASRFNGGSDEVLARNTVASIDGATLDLLPWSSVIQLASRIRYPIPRMGGEGPLWRQDLIAMHARQRTAVASREPDLFAGKTMVESLRASDLMQASLHLHRSLCGFPFEIPALESLTSALGQESTYIVRLLTVSAALTQSSSRNAQILTDFLQDTLRKPRPPRGWRTDQTPVEALWEHCLMLRCLGWFETYRRKDLMTAEDVTLAITCLTSHSVDCQHFAVKWLWSMRGLDREAVALCIAIAESGKVAQRWGAVLALAGAQAHASDKVIKCILVQLYDREYRFQGYSVRDVAAYALMRLADTSSVPS